MERRNKLPVCHLAHSEWPRGLEPEAARYAGHNAVHFRFLLQEFVLRELNANYASTPRTQTKEHIIQDAQIFLATIPVADCVYNQYKVSMSL